VTVMAEAPWAMAYRPLHPRRLLGQLALLAAVELLLFASYRGHEASFHWATHFLVGVSMAAVTNMMWLALKGAPARWQLVSVLAWHLFAMFPDLLFRAGVPHDGWMDVFLAHISSHYLPGGAYAWLLIALALSLLYAIVLARWLAARRAEAEAGMAPGVGLGGAALMRPHRDPRSTLLAHHRYGPHRPPDVLLLHGLAASGQLWVSTATELGRLGHAVLVPDLLGFGESRTIGTRFHLDDHTAAIRRLLDHYDGRPPLVAGHSFGCAVAVHLATQAPQSVRSLVLVSPPVFRDGNQAKARLGERGWLARKVLSGSPIASVTCGAMCALRRPAGALTVRLTRNVLPEAIARDSVQHSWPAYRDALAALLENNPLPHAIDRPPVPTTVIVGDADRETPAHDVLDWPHASVDVVEVAGADHLLPLRQPKPVVAAIAARER
jgi:pimeloyl-ACP methyl ester carboxylesterase